MVAPRDRKDHKWVKGPVGGKCYCGRCRWCRKYVQSKSKNLFLNYRFSPELQSVLGVTSGTRNQVLTLLWRYLKAHDLQDPTDKRFFYPDAKMVPIFGCGRVRCFSMAKYLAKHLDLIS